MRKFQISDQIWDRIIQLKILDLKLILSSLIPLTPKVWSKNTFANLSKEFTWRLILAPETNNQTPPSLFFVLQHMHGLWIFGTGRLGQLAYVLGLVICHVAPPPRVWLAHIDGCHLSDFPFPWPHTLSVQSGQPKMKHHYSFLSSGYTHTPLNYCYRFTGILSYLVKLILLDIIRVS